MDRKTYMKETYSKYWLTARETIYGFGEYNKNLCHYIFRQVPASERLLEVAIGTGYPIAGFLQKEGYSVYGAPGLIQRCRTINPNSRCIVADAENLPFPSSYFRGTYCFHSTWYFPDLNRAIDEMLRVTRSPGLVLFDIQNRNARMVDQAYRERLAQSRLPKRMIRYGKNVAKIILRRGTPVWHSVIHEVPTYPKSLYEHFKQVGIHNVRVMVRGEVAP